jgi:peptidoglycan/xylan/chitin deacetylase (PgdA/CDA1 family)
MRVIFTYDTEEPNQCVPKLRTILNVHRKFDAPLTTFVVGRLIESEGKQLKKLIDEGGELFDVNSHTYSHSRLIVKPPWSLPVPSAEFVHHEISRGVQAVRDVLDRPCRGFRPRSGAGAGFRGQPEDLDALRTAGCTWSSTYLKSTFGDSLPSDLHGPYSYQADGFDDIIELPGHGWPDCGVKDYGRGGEHAVRWPTPFVYPSGYVQNPDEEFEVHKGTLDAALEAGLPYCGLIMHPWIMIRDQDPNGKCIEMLLQYAKDNGWEVTTCDFEAQRCRENPVQLVEAPPVPPQRVVGYDVGRLFA